MRGEVARAKTASSKSDVPRAEPQHPINDPAVEACGGKRDKAAPVIALRDKPRTTKANERTAASPREKTAP